MKINAEKMVGGGELELVQLELDRRMVTVVSLYPREWLRISTVNQANGENLFCNHT